MPLQDTLRRLWPKVTIVNHHSGWTIVTGMPVVNVVRDEINQANKRGRLLRALEVTNILTGLNDPDL